MKFRAYGELLQYWRCRAVHSTETGYTEYAMQHNEQYTVTTAFVSPLYLVTILLGSFGNGMVIYLYVTDKAIQRTFNFLLTNLAIADFIICALFTPMLLAYRVHEKAAIIGYTPLCELSLFLSMFSISLTYFVFPLLAYHRKDVMFRSQRPGLSLGQARQAMRVFWFLCIFSGVMIVLFARREFVSSGPIYQNMYRCLLINQSLDLYSQVFLAYSTTLYSVSIVITAVMYFRIYGTYSTPGVNKSLEEWQVTKLCLWLSTLYSVCWMPFVLVQLFGVFGTYTELHFNLHGMASAVGVIGSGVAPLLYVSMIPYYRARLKYLLKGRAYPHDKKH